jgi:hypothetical protein
VCAWGTDYGDCPFRCYHFLPYTLTANINCHGGHAGVSSVECPSHLPRNEAGDYPCKVADVEECGHICAAMGTDVCNAMTWDNRLQTPAGETPHHYCHLRLVEDGADLTTANCGDGGGNYDLYVYNGTRSWGGRRALTSATEGGRRQLAEQEDERRLQQSDCVDTSDGAVDAQGQTCADFEQNPDLCEFATYDDADFSAEVTCCVCGGGTHPRPPPLPPLPPPPFPPGQAPVPPPHAPPLPHAPQDTGIGDDLAPHGGFEIWYSDVSAFFGTKARTVLTGQRERTSTYAIDRTARGDYARGRYVTLRIYHPHKRLRLETMEVFGALPDAGRRRLFEAPPEPTPSPKPSPSPTPPPDSEYVWGADPDDAWWNHLEVSRRAHELYARRMPPDAHGRSAAASVAMAITLAHPNRSVMVGQAATLYAMCGALGGCDQGDYWTPIHDRNDADVTEDAPDPQHLPIDDAGWALQLLSRAIEPAVHAVIEGMLICLSPALCASHCEVCNEWVGLGNATAEEVLRETELRLHASIYDRSRSVLDCVASFDCLAEVAAEVAKRLGSGDALPPTVRMKKVVVANIGLLEGARAETRQNASWQVRRPARFALLREHIDQVRAHEQTPLGEDDEVTEAGRRLAERPPPTPPPLTQIQELMKAATNETCRQLALKNSTGAHASHVQATHLWMVRPLSNPNPTITHAHTTDACVCPCFLVFGGRGE